MLHFQSEWRIFAVGGGAFLGCMHLRGATNLSKNDLKTSLFRNLALNKEKFKVQEPPEHKHKKQWLFLEIFLTGVKGLYS